MAENAGATGGKRVTLDGQLVRYWKREAARLDDMAERATFKWIARGYARKAARARVMAEQSRTREAARQCPRKEGPAGSAEGTAAA